MEGDFLGGRTDLPPAPKRNRQRDDPVGGANGARFPKHDHPGEEEDIIYGRAAVGEVMVEKADSLRTPPGGVHDLRAKEETLMLVTSANGIRIVE